MSDENAPAPASSPEANSIPKQRFDEVLQRNRELQQTLQFQGQQLQTLTQLIQNQRQPAAPQAETPEMEELKQSNPAMYKKFKEQDAEARRLRAATYSTIDRQDKHEFILEYGAEAKKRMAEVDQILENERRRTNGRTEATRIGIFQWLKSQERSQAEANTTARTPQAAPAPAPVQEEFSSAPSSDPSFATPTSTGSAGRTVTGKTFEDREKELENVVF